MPNYTPKTKPFKHQSRATLRAVRQRNHAVFFEPRLGKSKVALDYVGVLALKGEVSRVLILAPRIALDVWASEIHKHFPYPYFAETFTERWQSDEYMGRWLQFPDRKVDMPQFFLAGREETMRATRQGGRLRRPKQDTLERWRPDAIIVDESHEYKRPGGRGAQDLWRLVSRLRKNSSADVRQPYVLLLSGTPSAKGWRDLFAQYRIMDPTIFGTNVGDFDEDYCVYGQGPRKYTVIRYRRLERLRTSIAAHASSCTAEQAGLAGVITFQVLPSQLPAQVRETYDELAENFVAEIDGQVVTAANAGVKRLRLLQLASGFLTEGRILHRGKLEVTRDWLALLKEQREAVVCYCRFTSEVDAVADVARALRLDVSVVDGRTSQRDRTNAIRRFQAGKLDALVFQYQAGSQAIELSTAAEVLFTSLPDGWVQFWQCLNRVRGPNQKRPVRITAICASGTADRSVLYGLRAKEDIHRLLMRDPSRFLRGGYD